MSGPHTRFLLTLTNFQPMVLKRGREIVGFKERGGNGLVLKRGGGIVNFKE